MKVVPLLLGALVVVGVALVSPEAKPEPRLGSVASTVLPKQPVGRELKPEEIPDEVAYSMLFRVLADTPTSGLYSLKYY